MLKNKKIKILDLVNGPITSIEYEFELKSNLI